MGAAPAPARLHRRDRLPRRRRPDPRVDAGPGDHRGAGGSSSTRRPTSSCAACAPRSPCSARWSPGAAGPAWRSPAATRSAPAGLDMHIRGLQELGAVVRIEHGQVVADVPHGLVGANLWLDFPSVGRHREPRDGLGARRRHHRDRQRGPRARDHRPVPDAGRDGRPHRRHLHLDAGDRGRRRPAPGRAHAPSPTGSSPAPGSSPPPSPAATCTSSAGCRRHLDIVLDKLASAGAEIEPARRRASRCTCTAAALLRRRHAALPGVPDRPAAVRDGAGRGLARAPR